LSIFSGRDALKKHRDIHLNGLCSDTFHCDLCDKEFSSKWALKGHIMRHCSQSSLICDQCGTGFQETSSLKRHQLSHFDETPFHCEKCSFKCKTVNQLSNHLIAHDKPKLKFACQYCDRQFNFKNGLKAHERVHTLEKPFQCDFCPKQFRFHSTFIDHRRLHTKIYPYHCPYCDASFPNWQNYNKHVTRTKHYKCEFCELQFNAKHKLATHKLAEHSDLELPKECVIYEFECGVCGKVFDKKCSLMSHFTKHSDETPFQCSYCDVKFKAKKGLTRHEKSHTLVQNFFCEICKRYFSRKSLLRKHVREVHADIVVKIEK
jgi:KRAB domain-containing zinc finger protein